MCHDHRPKDWLALMLVLAAAAWARLSHLERIGVRTVDEGSYCFFAISLMNGDPQCIQDKPGQALILAGSFSTFGISQYAAVVASALIGLATVPALYLLGWFVEGKGAALLLAAAAAFQPYLLLYNRSAASDSNSFFFCVTALVCFMAGVGGPRGASSLLPRRRWLLLSGLSFGLASTVNLASVPPAALTGLFLIIVCRWKSIAVRRAVEAMGVYLGGAALGVGMVELPLAPYIDFPKVWSQLTGHAGHILATRIRWEWAQHLWMYLGPVELGLAGLGIAVARSWWKTPRALFPLLGIALIVFYARAALSLPRLHLPLLLPLLPLAASGAAWLVQRAHQRFPSVSEFTLHAALAACLVGLHVRDARHSVSLRSGYPEACHWLSEHMAEQDKGIGTHTWWTFMAFTGRTFSFGSELLGGALNGDNWRKDVGLKLLEFQKIGYRFWVIDYLILNRLNSAGFAHLSDLLHFITPEETKGVTIPNPVAVDYGTWAEDGLVPPLGDRPDALKIHIYRLDELCEELKNL